MRYDDEEENVGALAVLLLVAILAAVVYQIRQRGSTEKAKSIRERRAMHDEIAHLTGKLQVFHITT